MSGPLIYFAGFIRFGGRLSFWRSSWDYLLSLLLIFLFFNLVSNAAGGQIDADESVRRFNLFVNYKGMASEDIDKLSDADFFWTKVGKGRNAPYPDRFLELVRKRRPNAKVLVYEITYGRAETQVDWAEVNQHEEWFLHKGGKRIKSGNYWLMDLGNPGYIDHLVTINVQVAQKYGYDGVFLDNFFCQGLLESSIGCERFERSAERLMKGFKQQNPKFLIIYNGLRIGRHDDNMQYLKWADGIFMERFCTRNCDRLQDPKATMAYVKRLQKLDRIGKIVLVNATYQCQGAPSALNQEQFRHYCRYCLAAYLTGMGDHTFFRIRAYNPKDPQSGIGVREQPIPLGRPIGEPSIRDGVYIRDFSNGRVFWNPAETDMDFRLNTPLFTLARNKIQQVKVEKRSGVILFNHDPER